MSGQSGPVSRRGRTRRHFLRGAGVSLGLPWLPSLASSGLAGPAGHWGQPTCVAFLHFPNGVWQPDWTPQGTGHDYLLSKTLQPLSAVRQHVAVLTGLDKVHSHGGDGHYAKTANFLTGMPVRKTMGSDISAGGISVDQLIASHWKGQTPVNSLVVGAEPMRGGVDRGVGYTALYSSCISWDSASRPVTPDVEPRAVFERLFESRIDGDPQLRQRGRRLLDLVLQDARRMRGNLGRDDVYKLDEYLDAVRTVESRIEFSEQQASELQVSRLSPEQLAQLKPEFSADFRDRLSMMLDLLVLAFQTNTTRVCSMMLGNGVSSQSFHFLEGVTGGHHELSHHQNDPRKIAQYQKINQWYVQQFATFVQKLHSVQESDHSLLDRCMIVFGSGMSDGNAHDPDNLPILLAGGANLIPVGRHLEFQQGSTPLCNLYLSMLQKLGVAADSFGDSTGKLF
jgi:hypothetical protein